MHKLTVIIKRNASYEKGMYGLSIHNQPGGAANVEPINSEAQLREWLLGFGLCRDHVNGLIDSLKNKHDSVKLNDVAKRRILSMEDAGIGSTRYDCDLCSWHISQKVTNSEAHQRFNEHGCCENPPKK
jgi:hypothetical protein